MPAWHVHQKQTFHLFFKKIEKIFGENSFTMLSETTNPPPFFASISKYYTFQFWLLKASWIHPLLSPLFIPCHLFLDSFHQYLLIDLSALASVLSSPITWTVSKSVFPKHQWRFQNNPNKQFQRAFFKAVAALLEKGHDFLGKYLGKGLTHILMFMKLFHNQCGALQPHHMLLETLIFTSSSTLRELPTVAQSIKGDFSLREDEPISQRALVLLRFFPLRVCCGFVIKQNFCYYFLIIC